MVTTTHQLEPPGIAVVTEIPSEVEVIHKPKYKSKWMDPSRINPNEWDNILVGDMAICQYFIGKPL